jgi:hypothetical protein
MIENHRHLGFFFFSPNFVKKRIVISFQNAIEYRNRTKIQKNTLILKIMVAIWKLPPFWNIFEDF